MSILDRGSRRRNANGPAAGMPYGIAGAWRCLSVLAAVLLVPFLLPSGARSSGTGDHVLVMFEDPGCVYCRRWHAEIGPGYAKSAEGRFAPLARRQRGDADVAFVKGIAYSPTFVLLRGEEEIGRIVGYSGEDFFWGQLEPVLARAGFKPPAEEPTPAPLRETALERPALALR